MCYTLPMTATVPSYFSVLECPVCQEQFNPEEIQTFSDTCQSPLLSAYDLEKTKKDIPKSSQSDRRTRGVWRWHVLWLHTLVLPTVGNAGGALAAYAARVGMETHTYMPRDAPRINREEESITGANHNLVDGSISDAAEKAAENAHTIADGLCVPTVLAEKIKLSTLRESKGTAISVTDQEIKRAQALLGEHEGLCTSPEGTATLAAAIK